MSVKALENLNKTKIRSTLVTLPEPYATAEESYCLQMRGATCVKQQIECVRNIFKSGCSNRNILRFLCALYFASPLQHPLRQQIAKLLATAESPKNAKGLRNDVILELLIESIQQIVSEVQCEEISCDVKNAAIVSLLGCFENFDYAVRALELTTHLHLPLVNSSIENYLQQIRILTSQSLCNDYYLYIHNSIRLALFSLKKFDFSQMQDELQILQDLCRKIIWDPELPMDSRTNAGIILVYIARLFNRYKALIMEASNCQQPNQIPICMAVISVCNQEDVDRNSSHLADMCSHIINLANTNLLIPNILLAAARALQQMSKVFMSISAKTQTTNDIQLIVQGLLSFATMHIEHFMDSVRYICREILHNVLVIGKSIAVANPIELVYSSCNVERFTLSAQCVMMQIAATVVGAEDITTNCPELFTSIFPSHLGRDLRVNNLFEVLMLTHYKQATYDRWLHIWIVYLLKMAAVDDLHLAAVEALLVKAIECDSRVAEMIIKGENKSQITITTKLLALWTIRKSGILCHNFDDILQQHFEDIQIAIISNNDETRIAALRLLVETHKTTQPLTLPECGLIILYLMYNINCQSPSIRQQNITLLNKALVRCELNLMKVGKSKQTQLLKDSELEVLEVIFLRNVIRILIDNLEQNTNFSRRSISLQLLEPSIEIGIKCNLDLNTMLTKSVRPILYSVLSDSYEINRKSAVKILLILENLRSAGLIEQNQFCPNLESIRNYLSSIRPADSLTASYQLAFLCNVIHPQIFGDFNLPEYNSTFYAALRWLLIQLRKATNVAKSNIMEAAVSNPLYGLLVAIGHILNKLNLDQIKEEVLWCSCLANLIEICLELISIVEPITNNSSPEGYLPNGLTLCGNNPVIKGRKVTSQMILLCAWRTVKEISSILGYIVLNAPITAIDQVDTNTTFLTAAQILKISEQFKSLLLQTKHRGAFEQVYIGFSKLCCRLWTTKIDGLYELPFAWLKEILQLISTNNEYNEQICATRRSAGIPFLIQAVLISELKTGSNKALNYCMTFLLQISTAKETCCVCRTHAFNILRALFRCTDLSEAVGEFISDGVEVAIQAYDSSNWMEKNSATLLFAALIVRIFGVQRTKNWQYLSSHNRMTSRLFFMHYPKLFSFFLTQLQYATELIKKPQTTNKLHPLLIILGRLYPSSFDGLTSSNIPLRSFLPYIDACAAYGKLPTRILAAKATASIIRNDGEVSNIIYQKCVEIAGLNINTVKMNRLHGILLQILYLIRNRQTESSDLTRDIICTLVTFHRRCNINNSLILTTSLDICIELINRLTELYCTQIIKEQFEYFATLTMEYKTDNRSLILCPILFKSIFIFQLHTKRLSKSFDLMADYLLETVMAETCIELTESCLNVILLIVSKMQPLIQSAHLKPNDSQNQRDYSEINIDENNMDFAEFNFNENEWLFVKALPIEELHNLAAILCSSEILQQTLKRFLKNRLHYPEIAIKSYALLSRLDNLDFNLKELIQLSEGKSSEIKSAIAFCLESLINGIDFDRTKAELCLNYLANIYEAWQPNYLRYKAAVILSHLSIHYPTALKDIRNHLTFVRTYIKLILNLLMDDDQDIRAVAVNIVLKDLSYEKRRFSLFNNKFLDESLDLDSILPKAKTIVTTIAQNLFLQNTAQILYDLQIDDEYIIDILQGITHSLFFALAEKADNQPPTDELINAEIFEKNESNTFAEPTKAIVDLILIFQQVFADRAKIQHFLERHLERLSSRIS